MIKRILVVRTDRIGEALLNIPAMRALKQSFQAELWALVSPQVQELLTGCKEIDGVLTFEEAAWNRSILTRLKLWQRLRKLKFDLAVILNPTRRFHLLTYFSGIGLRLGYNRKWGCLLTHKIEDRKSQGRKHEVEYNLDLVRAIGADTGDKEISLKVKQQDLAACRAVLSKFGIGDGSLIIAIHPHSSNPTKCWPRENFARVADQLYAKYAAKVVIIGGKQERSAAGQMIALAKSPLVNLSGEFSLSQLAGFFQKCALLISNDSGPVHIASAVGARCIVIFGRNIPGTGPKRWGPWGSAHTVLHKDPGCDPCLDSNCPYDFKCLSSITPEEVLQAVKLQLEVKR